MKHPNAAMALGSGSGIGSLVVYLLDDVAKLGLSPVAAVAIGGAISSAFLFVGRNGFAGVWALVKHGTAGKAGA